MSCIERDDFWDVLTERLLGNSFSDAFFEQYPDTRSVIGLFDHLPSVLFYAKDANHRYIAVNQRTLTDVFGLESLQQLLGRSDLEFQPPALAEAYHAEDRRVMDSAKPIPNQVWLVPHVRGTPSWYVSSKTPLFASGAVIGIAGVMYPIATPEEHASIFRELVPVVQFVDANFTKPISMKQMAELTGLSATQFNLRFRSVLRMSPTDYVLSRRIQEAQKQLTESSEPIAEIGIDVGFVDQSHFTKRFRKVTGMTPLAYRNRFRKT
ncbi:MAG: AraC family transcriptional regulator [Verrucomicrobiota bacterium]